MAPICAGGIFLLVLLERKCFRFSIFSQSGGANSQSKWVNPVDEKQCGPKKVWIQISWLHMEHCFIF